MSVGQIAVIALSIVLAGWFVGGTWYNRRRTRQVWRWLEPGLDAFGGRVGQVWMSSSGSGLRVAVDNALAPLRRLEVIVRLESRENLWLWLFERLQGKKDQFTVRAWLRSRGRSEVEVVRIGSAPDRFPQEAAEGGWQRTNLSPRWMIARRGSGREKQDEALRRLVTIYDHQLQCFSRRRTDPHLFVQMSLDGLLEDSSRQLLSCIKDTLTT